MSRLKFTQLAREDFLEIGDYIAKDNPIAALDFVHRLQERCTLLTDHPASGRKRDEIEPAMRSATEGEYVIFYRALPDGIEVIRIIHSKRDLGKVSFSD
ncbi:MAG: type II toxin-antitoxin system RelE/ParE family toxin [Candidatus Melainabacteria bacterium]|nr:type II toxin-antitoxin system RelE/ParE family toxin [Candidatus Melainabacteria bacterium]